MAALQPALLAEPAPPTRGELLAAVRLEGEPQVAQRHRSGIGWKDGVPFVRTFLDARYRHWRDTAEAQLAAWWGDRPMIAVPVVGHAAFILPRPKHRPTSYTLDGEPHVYPFVWSEGRNPSIGGGDLDNLRKAVWDALVGAHVLADDRLVVRDSGAKLYAGAGEGPAVEVRLWRA